MSRESTEEAGEQATEWEVSLPDSHLSQSGDNIEEGKNENQGPHDELEWRDRSPERPDPPCAQGLQAGERSEQPGAGKGGDNRREPESQHDPTTNVASQQCEFEEVVGEMNNGRGGDRNGNRKNECEYRKKERTETETGQQGQTGYDEGYQSYQDKAHEKLPYDA